MIKFSDAITLQELLNKYPDNKTALDQFSELTFFFPLADHLRKRGCHCGKHQEIEKAQICFNDIFSSLSEENVVKLKVIFGKEKICFGLQSREKFELKCY